MPLVLPVTAAMMTSVPALPSAASDASHTSHTGTAMLEYDRVAVTAGSPQGHKPRVVFFGSSTTEGVGASRPDRRYSSLLSRYLGWEEVNAGLSGSRLSNAGAGQHGVPPSALQRWQTDVAAKHPDRIFLMYGANDMHKEVPMSTFEPATAELLGNLKGIVGPEHLIVNTMQPMISTGGDPALYNGALTQAATKAGIGVIDSGVAFPAHNIKAYSFDSWHLNDLGHAALASYLAAQLTDRGWAPAAPIATGGNAVSGAVSPMAAGTMLIDQTTPLSAGEVRHIETRWLQSGTAVIGIVRPNAATGFDMVYRTDDMTVSAGTSTVDVPRWRVLPGDRLAVWTSGAVVAGTAADSQQAGTLAVPTTSAKPLRDVKAGEGQVVPTVMASHVTP